MAKTKTRKKAILQGVAIGGGAVLASDHVGAMASNCDTIIGAIFGIFTGGC